MRAPPPRNVILLSPWTLLLAACDPQPKLNVAWYMYPPAIPEENIAGEAPPPPDPRKSEIILYIGNQGGESVSISNVRIGDVLQNTVPFALEGAGSYRIVSYHPSTTPAPALPVTCRLPTSIRVLWSPRTNKSPRWSKSINFGGKSPGYIPDKWFGDCYVPIQKISPQQ